MSPPSDFERSCTKLASPGWALALACAVFSEEVLTPFKSFPLRLAAVVSSPHTVVGRGAHETPSTQGWDEDLAVPLQDRALRCLLLQPSTPDPQTSHPFHVSAASFSANSLWFVTALYCRVPYGAAHRWHAGVPHSARERGRDFQAINRSTFNRAGEYPGDELPPALSPPKPSPGIAIYNIYVGRVQYNFWTHLGCMIHQ